MRCLTLAEALRKEGAEVEFICRAHDGNLLKRIEDQGFKAYVLPKGDSKSRSFKQQAREGELYGELWLGATQQQDAEWCKSLLDEIKPDWLVVDHYALDETWEQLLSGRNWKLMVIDDLANRKHRCDLLLDQTYGRKEADYGCCVQEDTQLLLGSEYALLRPEFSEWRAFSIKRRAKPELKKLLINMGGVDSDNVTSDVLEALKECTLPKALEISIVMGATAPHLECVKKVAELIPCKTTVKVDVMNMAEVMAKADLAIGAAGATTWERCCLGLPAFIVSLADNQKEIMQLLERLGIALVLDKDNMKVVIGSITSKQLLFLSVNARKVLDGRGAERVAQYMYEYD
jgi:UDP-2,4-diacetamido-2,4,6-trideoxy-beta-L-altropyranose hydrolase